jgi:hypothetical protein
MKLMARKHVCALPRQNVVPTESHSDGHDAGSFPRTRQTVLLAVGSSEPPLLPLACTCGDLREAYKRSYPPHLPSGRGSCTEVDV